MEPLRENVVIVSRILVDLLLLLGVLGPVLLVVPLGLALLSLHLILEGAGLLVAPAPTLMNLLVDVVVLPLLLPTGVLLSLLARVLLEVALLVLLVVLPVLLLVLLTPLVRVLGPLTDRRTLVVPVEMVLNLRLVLLTVLLSPLLDPVLLQRVTLESSLSRLPQRDVNSFPNVLVLVPSDRVKPLQRLPLLPVPETSRLETVPVLLKRVDELVPVLVALPPVPLPVLERTLLVVLAPLPASPVVHLCVLEMTPLVPLPVLAIAARIACVSLVSKLLVPLCVPPPILEVVPRVASKALPTELLLLSHLLTPPVRTLTPSQSLPPLLQTVANDLLTLPTKVPALLTLQLHRVPESIPLSTRVGATTRHSLLPTTR